MLSLPEIVLANGGRTFAEEARVGAATVTSFPAMLVKLREYFNAPGTEIELNVISHLLLSTCLATDSSWRLCGEESGDND